MMWWWSSGYKISEGHMSYRGDLFLLLRGRRRLSVVGIACAWTTSCFEVMETSLMYFGAVGDGGFRNFFFPSF